MEWKMWFAIYALLMLCVSVLYDLLRNKVKEYCELQERHRGLINSYNKLQDLIMWHQTNQRETDPDKIDILRECMSKGEVYKVVETPNKKRYTS